MNGKMTENLIQFTKEDAETWNKEFLRWAQVMEGKGDTELARKSYIVAALMDGAITQMTSQNETETVTTFYRKSSLLGKTDGF
jgi:hypothetical protein